MSPEDLELTVRLARWMGWTEAQDDRERHELPAEVIAFATLGAPDTLMTYRIERGRRVGADWLPLTRPDHAAEVMAEAVRRGWRVRVIIDGGAEMQPHVGAMVTRQDADGDLVITSRRLPETGSAHPLPSWCRAVCLAVLAAEGGA